MFALMQLC